MIYGEQFKISLQNAAGDYYVATETGSNTYTVTTTPTLTYIKDLPKEWDNFAITFERNMTYYGVFRSQSDKFIFVTDARAILLSLLFGGGGISAYCKMTIYEPNSATFTYDVFYVSEIDLSTAKDDKRLQQIQVATLDSKLNELVKAKANSKINIPFWSYSAPTWSVANDAKFIWHDGIKLFWGANYISGATAANPIYASPTGLYGFNDGSVSDARHWIPAMNIYNKVQNNGTTTFVGNDILQPLLIQRDQPFNYNRNFEGTEDIQGYTKNQCLLKNLLKNPTDADVVDMVFTLRGQYEGDIVYSGISGRTDQFIGFVLFEISPDDLPVMSGGNYQYTMLYYTPLPSAGGSYTPPASGVFSVTQSVPLKYDRAYVLGIIYDDLVTGISGHVAEFGLINLELTIESEYNSGTLSPVSAPVFPASTIIALKPHKVFQAIVANLDSTRTNAYGFPVAPSSSYTGYSEYLADDTLTPEIDYVPALTWITTENALRDINGFPYMTWTLADFFNTFDRLGMCGMSIEGDVLRLENREFFFDKLTQILDLGADVAELEIIPFVEILGNNVKAGYSSSDLNSNFSTDSFAIPQDYDLPLNKTPKTIDLQITQANADMYFIEKARAQNNSNDSSASSSNNNVLIEVVDTIVETPTISNPAGADVTVSAYGIKKYPTAQSTDPTAATEPFIKGFKYPETVINTGITPASNLRRHGNWIRVLMDGFGTAPATDYVSYRTQYQQQYNDPSAAALTLPGMSKNIDGTTGRIDEVKDIDVTNFGSPMCKPYILRFKSGYPANMYDLINANPYGYIQFTWNKTVFKGFIYRVTQVVGNKKSTIFELLCHPDVSNFDLRIS
jgi:hypothetical protein